MAMAIVLAVLVGCTGAGAPPDTPTATATRDPGPERTATAKAQQEAAKQASRTAAALETQNAQATVDAQASATAALETQAALDRQATSTRVAIERKAAATEVVMQATAQAQPMYDLVQDLYAEGVISTDQGSYIQASDFEESWAQLNYYQYWLVEEASHVSMGDFVLSADIAWKSASDKANWFESGCGFVIIDPETERHHFVVITMDGYAGLLYNDGGRTAYFKAKKRTNAKGIPEGSAEFVLVIQDKTITVYVNGVQAFSYTEPIYKPGVLTYSLVSGTNKDYGTYCHMTNVGLWAIESDK